MTRPPDPITDPELDQLLHGAGRDPASRNAVRTLEWAARNRQPIVTDGILLTWLQLWEHGMRPALLTTGIAEQHQLNQLARAALRLAGHLTGPDLQLRIGLRVAVGDQLVVTTDDPRRRPDALPKGTLLHVTDAYPAGQTCTVDIPTVGEQRHLSTADPLVRRISHAYATTRTAEQERNPPGAARQPAQGLSW